MSFTNATENAELDERFASTTYMGWSTTTPTKAGGNVTEPSTGGYARIAVPASSVGSAATGAITNTVIITGDAATASQGTPDTVCFWTAASGGTPFAFSDTLTGAAEVTTGKAIRVPIGSLTIQYAQS